jgi:methanogenic corrinoid protein MtbC1
MGARAPSDSPPHAAELREGLLVTLQAADQTAAHGIVERAMGLGWTADQLRFDLITPGLHEIGARWERGEIGVADEHLATSVCEWLLFTIAGHVRRPPASGRRAVVGCSEGELHSVAPLMLANVLAERGWRVLFLGASIPAAAWAPIVSARRVDVAVLSTTTTAAVREVAVTLRSIHAARPACLTVVGGQAYEGEPELEASLGAGLVTGDARGLPGRLEERLG